MNWLLLVFIVYVVSYLLLEILWIYIEEEDGSFLDHIIDGIWCWEDFMTSLVGVLCFPAIAIWAYAGAVKDILKKGD